MAQHLLTLDAIDAKRFHDLLAVATYLKNRRAAGVPEHALAGKTLAMVFEKPSLRTRISFEVAMTELGGRALYIRGEEIGIGKREAIQDIARVLGRMVQGIMARVFRHDTVTGLAKWSGVPVVNGLCDLHHPCQALGDFLTMREHFGRIDGLTVVFVGDGNNVARSLAHACRHAGSRFVLACPKGYGFDPAETAALGVTEHNDPAAAVAGAHVLYSDVWTSMGQEAESAKRLKDFQGFQIDEALLAKSAPDARIMHCLPAHRGEEITDGAMEHPRSIVFDQAENRLHAQKAVLRLLMAADGDAVVKAAGR
ncbi:MAG: ornithine carbamoyltransferase [Planctomycetes bacterium]|nr:ornithine carbamoyltransferase [Planctomycetota bacterium]